ncbi:MAG: ABC transporter ATP-binding protein [Pseudomonadales bacterium]
MMSQVALLSIEDLSVEFATRAGRYYVSKSVSLSVARGQTLALVGESGCGKSVTMRSILGLLPGATSVVSGRAMFGDINLLQLDQRALNRVRGKRIAMIFQEPTSALNPTLRIGTQISEVLRLHQNLSKGAALKRAVELLDGVRIPEPAHRCRQYPFELSGGMLQRVMIAMALAGEPELLIADEPTTALDTTIQAQILDLLKSIQQQRGMSIVLVTHDLGIVARMADQVAVMYAGEIVEQAGVDSLFDQPMHPYTQGLLAATPRLSAGSNARLQAIPGAPPDLRSQRAGCSFAPRCAHCMQICLQQGAPRLDSKLGHYVHCWRYHTANPTAPRTLALS